VTLPTMNRSAQRASWNIKSIAEELKQTQTMP
jgi:hypothetical protein